MIYALNKQAKPLAAKLLEYYSSNIEMQNVYQFQQDINMLSYSVVFIKNIVFY